jgi:3',5'-cyclic AMP phosphodiesterase CpdA
MNSHEINEPDGRGGLDRRRLLRCGAWAGAGVMWTLRAGVPAAALIGAADAASPAHAAARAASLTFVQISDSHIGFNKPANPDPVGTLQAAIARIKAAPVRPAFVLHTGDVTHLSKASEFDTAQAMLQDLGIPVHVVPGEHDTQDPGNGKLFLERFGKGTRGDGWYSFDAGGAHFIALVNVVHLRPGGAGGLGPDQIAWLKDDVAHLRASTPIVVFAHMPLWSVYPEWGWGTEDAAEALAPLARFGSVTVLNGHIHQIQQKVEGNMRFYTARSTAYPQPQPGAAPAPGPLVVPPSQLNAALGLREVVASRGAHALAVTDLALDSPVETLAPARVTP